MPRLLCHDPDILRDSIWILFHSEVEISPPGMVISLVTKGSILFSPLVPEATSLVAMYDILTRLLDIGFGLYTEILY